MNYLKSWLITGCLMLGLSLPLLAQDILPEITVRAVRYKYLNAVDQKDLAQPVKMLQKMAAEYDVKASDLYVEDYDEYQVSFYIPSGTILASYDREGKLLSTVERYTDIALPEAVRTAIGQRYPGWSIPKDVYLVNYYEQRGATKVYKVTLQNGDKRIRVKTNDKGEFI